MGDTKIGQNLKEARLKLNLTQKQIAEKAEVNTNWYARLERGEENASLKTLKKFAAILKVKVSNLIPF
jgi:transcriptional regulator with XRE-family HTH domain